MFAEAGVLAIWLPQVFEIIHTVVCLALQLSFFEMSALGCGLMCPAPE
jgi:hypothetical protein